MTLELGNKQRPGVRLHTSFSSIFAAFSTRKKGGLGEARAVITFLKKGKSPKKLTTNKNAQ